MKISNLQMMQAGACALILATLPGPVHGQSPSAKPAAPEIRGEPIKPLAPAPNAPVSPAPPAASGARPATGGIKGVDGSGNVAFDLLASYKFDVPDKPLTNNPAKLAEVNGQIPAPVKSLNEKKVIVRGFMLPLKLERGKVTEFLLLRNPPACCYGVPPMITEWVTVKVHGKGLDLEMGDPVSIQGTLRVGATRDREGYFDGLYQMEGERIVDEKGK